jgi:hypothetical protein
LTAVARRTQPLRAGDPSEAGDGLTGAAAEAEAEMEALAHDVVLDGPATPPRTTHADVDRERRLADGVRGLRTSGHLKLGERTLMILGGILAPLGLVLVLVGWYGAAHTPNLFEQIPYAISGGLFGLGLAFLGAFCYFAHWMTELVREHRSQSAAVVDAIERLEQAVRTTSAATAAHTITTSAVEVDLVATEKGTMAHRPDCVVVAGKADIRPVGPSEHLALCKLCDAAEVAAN